MKRTSNKALVRRIQVVAGMSRHQAQFALAAVLESITTLLGEGKPVSLWKFGRFYFKFRKGRTLPPSRTGIINRTAMTVQADSYSLKFSPAENLRQKLARHRALQERNQRDNAISGLLLE